MEPGEQIKDWSWRNLGCETIRAERTIQVCVPDTRISRVAYTQCVCVCVCVAIRVKLLLLAYTDSFLMIN